MKILIVGIGALGGTIAARAIDRGIDVCLATRSAESAEALRESGLRVSGIGGDVQVAAVDVAPITNYRKGSKFHLIVLATKAQDALNIAPVLMPLLVPSGVLLPIQNGGVARMLADRFGVNKVLGGISNLGATMVEPGVYEQRNAGHLLIGELAGGRSERTERVGEELGRAIEVRTSPNLTGSIWSKLLLNCSVTTIGAITGRPMREYISSSVGRELFDRIYDEALSVALANGAQPERMIVDPIPPAWRGRSVPSEAHNRWLDQIVQGYGDAKPSMSQDIERGHVTEIDFINGYVVDVARQCGVRTPANAAIVGTVHAITCGQVAPGDVLLGQVLRTSD
ncbi:ketopantoate reductase family protein [Terriglobus sp. RCC_193]|uniref:ketopantoate reductase family protein n=1 Tax=Terriglobus sp. RCC_193 TaxID=3239218 RepID=UPI0035246BDA